jgi:hypothetical protein
MAACVQRDRAARCNNVANSARAQPRSGTEAGLVNCLRSNGAFSRNTHNPAGKAAAWAHIASRI